MMNTSLLQKSGLATLQVAQILAGLEPGDRIPTVTELSEQCEMARGNIQIALNNLKQNHVICLESHGQNRDRLCGNGAVLQQYGSDLRDAYAVWPAL